MDRPCWIPRPAFLLSLVLLLTATRPALAERLPLVTGVEFQPLSAQARRVADALEVLGRPLPPKDRERLFKAIEGSDPEAGVRVIQQVLDAHCLIGIEINAESRVKSTQGPAPARLVQNGWSAFLVKVQNGAGVTAELAAGSPNAAPVFRPSSGSAEPKPSVPAGAILQRWMDVAMFQARPLKPELSGLLLEYRIIEIYSRDAGRREARISFNVGQGSQDLGFRSDVDILFTIDPAIPITLEVRDADGQPAMASFLIRDGLGRVHPSAGRRLAPDFYFHPQIYRKDGETITLPPGRYEVEYTRGPEYRTLKKPITVRPGAGQRESFRLERWIHVADQKWFSGDHHVHAAGCGHYESPSEGVKPEDMWRHIIGEDLDVGCVLAWGPCWYYQKQFFEGKTNALSTADNVMRYDVEVSGFPSSHAGHLCLLRLKEDDYPGTTRIEEWPSWDLPVLKWGKSQGAVVGFSHSGWGLRISTDEIPSLELPPFDGIGANEYVVDVVHDAVDFISTVDTPAPWELNIWYHTLNCGYRARISGETDFPCIYGERVGLGRVYVKLPDGKLDFDRWCQGLKEGRSYVGDGRSHLIDFRVNERAVGEDGSELKLVAPGTVKVQARVAAYLDPTPSAAAKAIRKSPLSEKPYWDLERARIGESRTVPVELVVNGKAMARKEIEADGTIRDIAFDIPLKASSWIALRILPSSHTNPVFVLVGNKPIRASKSSADWCLKAVDRCWAQKESAIRPADRDEAKRAYDAARVSYAKIRDEAVGD